MQAIELFRGSARFSAAALLVVALSGCSGHPGAGTWTLADNSAGRGFKGIQVKFDGNAVLYQNDDDSTLVQCRWHAVTAENIALFCQSEQSLQDPTQGIEYALDTVGENESKRARLLLNDNVLGEFTVL